MANLVETLEWIPDIFRKETTTAVRGGDSDQPSNIQAKQLANRTLWIKDVLKDNSIYIDPTEYNFQGQNFIKDVTFDTSVANGDFVYYYSPHSKYYRAIAGSSYEPVGMADITNNRVIIDGLVPSSLTTTYGDKIYLSASSDGEATTTDTGVHLGYHIKTGMMRLNLRDYIPEDPIAATPGMRTLGTGSKQACAGDDSRLDSIVPTGVIVMWSGLLINIPSGWNLCDGLNGSPDLRDKFIMGASAGVDPGDTGGNNTHNHTVGYHALTKDEIPAHVHTQIYTKKIYGYAGGSGYGSKDPTTTNTGDGQADGLGGVDVGGGITTGAHGHNHLTDQVDHLPTFFTIAYIIKG